MHTWPSVPEQVQAISSLHPMLAAENIFFLVDTSKTSNVDSTNVATRALHWSDNKGFGLILSIFTTILGGLMWLEVNWNGNSGDTTTYAASAPYLQQQGCTFPLHHTGLGDALYRGPSSHRAGSALLINTATLNNVLPQHQLIAAIHSRLTRRLRQPVECAIRIGKRGLGGNGAKIRISISTPESRMKASTLIKCAFLHFHGIQLMRGQVSMSNPEVLSPTGVNGRVDIATKISNIALENLLTADGYHRQFFGYLSNGLNHNYPPVVRFPAFP